MKCPTTLQNDVYVLKNDKIIAHTKSKLFGIDKSEILDCNDKIIYKLEEKDYWTKFKSRKKLKKYHITLHILNQKTHKIIGLVR